MSDTKSYTPSVKFGPKYNSLLRWKGSLYRLIWKELIAYTVVYLSISFLYDFGLSEPARKEFDDIAAYCTKYTSALPIILLLGFFTSTSMQRWFSLVTSMPGTTKVISSFVLTIKEDQPEGHEIVLQYARWVVLGWALTFRIICKPLKKLFPDLVSLENAGLLQSHERLQLETESSAKQPLVVFQWKLAFLKHCHEKNVFMDYSDYVQNREHLLTFKKSCGDTLKFAAKNIPSALIQAVTITVYAFGLASLMARQVTEKHTPTSFITKYFPVLNTFQYFLYYLWLKFGTLAAYPFGDDEEDIDIKLLLQSHIEDAARWISLYSSRPSNVKQLVARSLANSSENWLGLRSPKGQEKLLIEPLTNGNQEIPF